MLTKKIILSAPSGLHARPASEFVKLVKDAAPAKVTLSNGVKTVNAASMLSLLGLGLKCGSELEIAVDGAEESSIMDKLSAFLESIKD